MACNPRSATKSALLTSFTDLWSRRETVWSLVTTQLKSGHRDKVFGHLWSLLDPILFMLVYYFVFGVLFGQTERGRAGDFMLYIFVGVLAWRFFDAAVAQSTSCVRANRGLIHEISFPKSVFPVSICLSRLYDFLWGLVVVVAALWITGNAPSLYALWTLPLIAVQLLFTIGLAFVVAFLGAFFVDTVNIVSVGLRLWFFMTPIFYYVRGDNAVIKDETLLTYYMLNPLACFCECYRDVLIAATSPEPRYFLYGIAVSLVTAVCGFALFSAGEGKFAKYV